MVKKLATLIFAGAVVMMSVQLPHAQNAAPQLGKNTVKEVVAAMTTEEKVKLLVGMGMIVDIVGQKGYLMAASLFWVGARK